MKNLILALMLSMPLIFTQTTFATENDPGVQILSPEISAVLLTPEYAELITVEVRKAKASGKELRITDASVVRLEERTYVYLALSRRAQADLNGWTPYGHIVAGIQYGPMGELTIDSLYFTPAGEPPGGGSVGNM